MLNCFPSVCVNNTRQLSRLCSLLIVLMNFLLLQL